MAVTDDVIGRIFGRYHIVSESGLRIATQNTMMHVDTLPTTRTAQVSR